MNECLSLKISAPPRGSAACPVTFIDVSLFIHISLNIQLTSSSTMVGSKVLLFARRFQAKNCISLILIGAVLLLIVGSGSHRKSEWIASSTVMRGTDNNKNADAVKRDLTPREIIEYFYWSNRSSCQLVHDFGGQMLRNPSGLDGQKAVCLDSAVRPQSGDCIVYSFGINHEWSFAIVEKAGINRFDSKYNPW